jgi:hypothetical protein
VSEKYSTAAPAIIENTGRAGKTSNMDFEKLTRRKNPVRIKISPKARIIFNFSLEICFIFAPLI